MATGPSPVLSRLEWLLLAVAVVVVAVASHAFIVPGLIGWINDDSQYAASARALASGLGYVDTSNPAHPPAPRFPIGFPLMLVPIVAGVPSLAEQVSRLLWVSPVAMGLFVALTYVYYRRYAHWSVATAALVSFLVAVHPDTDKIAAVLLSDLPFAALGLIAIMLMESNLKDDGPRTRRWLLAGALVGALCLIRYAGFALVGATVLVLLWERRFKAIAPWLVGLVALFGPWIIYRVVRGGEEYHEWLSSSSGQGSSPIAEFIGTSASMLMANVLPSFLAPTFFEARNLTTFAIGTVLTAITFLGGVAWLNRPLPHQTRLPAAYTFAMTGLVLVWMVQWLLTGTEAMARLLIPVVPFLFIGFGRGLLEIRSYFRNTAPDWERKAVWGVLTVLCLFASFDLAKRLQWTFTQPYAGMQAEYQAMFDFIREKTPPKAPMVTMMSPMLHLYTDRPTYFLKFRGGDKAVLGSIIYAKAQYVVGMPYYLYVPGKEPGSFVKTDVMMTVLTDLIKAYPKLLQPVHFGTSGTIAVFKIDQQALAEAYAKAP